MTGGYDVASVVNQSLDMIGWPEPVGDVQDGSHAANVANRAYRLCRQQLLRAAHWDFCRKQAPMTLLADATGNTDGVGTVVPSPWLYEYSYPTDCMKMRFVPQNLANPSAVVPSGNTQIPNTPLVGGLGALPPGMRIIPTRFLVSSDYNYPATGDTTGVQGVSPQSRVVILSNVREAQAVYTADMLYPTVWDPLFRGAFVAYLAAEIAVPVWAKRDPSQKTGIAARDRLIPIVADKLSMARATNGNEIGGASTDLSVDWMKARRTAGVGAMGGWGNGTFGPWDSGAGLGVLWLGWDSLSVAGGTTF